MRELLPKTWEEIPGCLGQMTEKSRIVGGGTDLIIKMRMGLVEPDALCYLGYVKELKEIHEEGDSLVIGAYATMTQIEKDPRVRLHYPALMDAASDVGSLQIRNNGTIGGNIGNASPAGDLLPVLYLYDAVLEIMGPAGVRRAGIDEVLAGPGRLNLGCREAIVRIILPPNSLCTSFVKLGSRKKVTISRIGVALGIAMDGDAVKEMRLIVGAIGLKPVRFKEAEDFIRAKALNEPNIMDIAEILSRYIKENVAKEFDRDYKVYAAKGAVMDAFVRLRRGGEENERRDW